MTTTVLTTNPEVGDIIAASQMKEGDVVRFANNPSPYGTQTVLHIDTEKGTVKFLRPYIAQSDFRYTGGIIGTLGFEEYRTVVSDHTEYILLERRKFPPK